MVKKAQGKQMGQGCSRENKWDAGARKQYNQKGPNGYIESQITSPKRPSRLGSNNITAGITG